MNIRPLASGSSGNCYFVSDGETDILLDCGISVKVIRTSLWNMGARLSDIAACFVTHEHGDHIRSAANIVKNGIDIYTSAGTIRAAHLEGHRAHKAGELQNIYIGSMKVTPFKVVHDAEEPFGYKVHSLSESKTLVYLTDTMYVPYDFGPLEYVMIEANYSREIIENSTERGRIGQARAVRTSGSHLSIDGALAFLEKMDKSHLEQVWLLHLSEDNSDEADFKRRTQEVCGCEVYVA